MPERPGPSGPFEPLRRLDADELNTRAAELAKEAEPDRAELLRLATDLGGGEIDGNALLAQTQKLADLPTSEIDVKAIAAVLAEEARMQALESTVKAQSVQINHLQAANDAQAAELAALTASVDNLLTVTSQINALLVESKKAADKLQLAFNTHMHVVNGTPSAGFHVALTPLGTAASQKAVWTTTGTTPTASEVDTYRRTSKPIPWEPFMSSDDGFGSHEYEVPKPPTS